MNITKLFCFLFFITVVPAATYSQTDAIDSIKKVLAGKLPDTTRVQTLLTLAGEEYLSSPLLAMQDCEQAKIITEKIQYEDGKINVYGWLAYLFEQQGDIDKALDFNRQ